MAKQLLLCTATLLSAATWGVSIDAVWKDSVVVFKMPTEYTSHRANLWCQQTGLRGLASFHNQGENGETADAMAELNLDSAWIGKHSNGQDWVWDDGSLSNFERWGANQGNGGASADMRAVIHSDDGLWYEALRSDLHFGIACAGTSIAVHSAKKSWADANEECKNTYGTQLTAIHTSGVDSLISNIITKYDDIDDVWVGMKDDQDEGKWYWQDGTPDFYTNWRPGSGNNGDNMGEEDCGHVTPSGWEDSGCSTQMSFACSTPVKHANSVVNDKFRVTAFYGDFNLSEEYCHSFGTHVATITDIEENMDIAQMARGLRLDRLWIGYVATSGQTWFWRDGSDSDFENWGHAQPVEHEHAQMLVNDEMGRWENVAGGVQNILKVGVVCNVRLGDAVVKKDVYSHFRDESLNQHDEEIVVAKIKKDVYSHFKDESLNEHDEEETELFVPTTGYNFQIIAASVALTLGVFYYSCFHCRVSDGSKHKQRHTLTSSYDTV